MKITRFKIYRYNIALNRPVRIAQKHLTNRVGLILALGDDENHVSFGEIAPLPGLHEETIDDCLQQIALLKKKLLIKNDMDMPNEPPIEWTDQRIWAPSIQFGVEAAYLNLISMRQSILLPELFSKKFHKTLTLNALLSGSHNTIIRSTQNALSSHYHSLKLKVGTKSLNEDIQLTKEIASLIKGKATLRLDANRSWNFDQAIQFAKQTSNLPIDYIEEPLKDINQISQFFKMTHIPIALDETLRYIDPDTYKIPVGIKSLVLKPSIIGDLAKIKKYHRLAMRNNIDVVYSDTFHSGVGLSYSTCLAASLMVKNVPIGLDTYQWLSQDLLVNKFVAKAGKLDVVKTAKNSADIKFSLLHEIN